MRYTPHLENCCQVLMSTSEYPSDVYLFQLVQLHRLMRKYGPFDGDEPNMSMALYVRCVQDDLRRFRESIPPHLAQDSK